MLLLSNLKISTLGLIIKSDTYEENEVSKKNCDLHLPLLRVREFKKSNTYTSGHKQSKYYSFDYVIHDMLQLKMLAIRKPPSFTLFFYILKFNYFVKFIL